MSDQLVCWQCGESIEDLPQPLGRYDICPKCRSELYVCKMCELYDPTVSLGCKETIAEEVKNKERANFCNFFQVKPNAFQPNEQTAAKQQAMDKLEGLFSSGGATSPSPSTPGNEEARQQLDELFGTTKKDE